MKLGREEGQNLILFALAMTALFAMLSLVIDGGFALVYRREMQNAADMAALAGVRELGMGHSTEEADARTNEYGILNGAESIDVNISGNTVRASTFITYPTIFGGVIGRDQFSISAQAAASYGAVAAMTSGVYPIAADWQDFEYGETYDIFAGGGPGNFGWLGWDGCTNTPCLCESLTPPGNSEGYINPHDSTDHTLNIGDWVEGTPGTKNASCVRNALDDFVASNSPITVVVWDESEGNGSHVNYRIVGFAQFILEDYRLPGQGRITGRFVQMVLPVTTVTFDDNADFGTRGARLVQ